MVRAIEYFEFYEGDNYYSYWRTEKAYMMQWGICSQHVMMSKHRISKKEYEEAKVKCEKIKAGGVNE